MGGSLSRLGRGTRRDPISKITNVKRTGSVAQVVEHLPSPGFNSPVPHTHTHTPPKKIKGKEINHSLVTDDIISYTKIESKIHWN
jgi:hypothetical protein